MTTPRTAAGSALLRLMDDEGPNPLSPGSYRQAELAVAAIEAEAIRQERARLAEAVEGLPSKAFGMRYQGWIDHRDAVLALLREEDTLNG